MDLPMTYNEEEEWKKVMLMYDSALKEVLTKIEILNNEFKLKNQYNPIEHVTSRLKSPQSIAKKIRHNGRELTIENIVKCINDVAGVRIICSFTSDIYRIADLLAKQSDVQVLKVKDYIMCPKPNGYTSYHMIITVPIFLSNTMVNTKVEIQIRTIAMDFWASLEHKIYYKFEGNAPERIRKELKECADIVAYLDQKMLSLNEQVKSCNIDMQEDGYKEIDTDRFQEMIRDSYGKVMDEETEEETKIIYRETKSSKVIGEEMVSSENTETSDNLIDAETFDEININNLADAETFDEINIMSNEEVKDEFILPKEEHTKTKQSKKKDKENEKQKNSRISFLGIRI